MCYAVSGDRRLCNWSPENLKESFCLSSYLIGPEKAYKHREEHGWWSRLGTLPKVVHHVIKRLLEAHREVYQQWLSLVYVVSFSMCSPLGWGSPCISAFIRMALGTSAVLASFCNLSSWVSLVCRKLFSTPWSWRLHSLLIKSMPFPSSRTSIKTFSKDTTHMCTHTYSQLCYVHYRTPSIAR